MSLLTQFLFFSSALNVCVLSCLLFFNIFVLKLAFLERGLSDSPPGLHCGFSVSFPLATFPLFKFYSYLLNFFFSTLFLNTPIFLYLLCILGGELDSRNIRKHLIHRKPIFTFKTQQIIFQDILDCVTTVQALIKCFYCLHDHLQYI